MSGSSLTAMCCTASGWLLSQTSDLSPQTSDLRPQTSDVKEIKIYISKSKPKVAACANLARSVGTHSPVCLELRALRELSTESWHNKFPQSITHPRLSNESKTVPAGHPDLPPHHRLLRLDFPGPPVHLEGEAGRAWPSLSVEFPDMKAAQFACCLACYLIFQKKEKCIKMFNIISYHFMILNIGLSFHFVRQKIIMIKYLFKFTRQKRTKYL